MKDDKNLKLAIRIDDPPLPLDSKFHGPEKIRDEKFGLDEFDNMTKISEKYGIKLSIAIPMGWLAYFDNLIDLYKQNSDQGLFEISCHGWYHEIFAGETSVFNKPTTYGSPEQKEKKDTTQSIMWKGLTLEQCDTTLHKCQEFAEKVFGKKCKTFVPPGREAGTSDPSFNDILTKNDFQYISAQTTRDPLCETFRRTENVREIPVTLWVDPWPRKEMGTQRFVKHTETTYSDYVLATKLHIDTRFKLGLYVNLLSHCHGFRNVPMDNKKFKIEKNINGKFIDEILSWTVKKYPEVEFVGMEDLVPNEL